MAEGGIKPVYLTTPRGPRSGEYWVGTGKKMAGVVGVPGALVGLSQGTKGE